MPYSRCTVSALALLLLLHTGPLAAQRVAPARFAPVPATRALTVDARVAAAEEKHFSTPLFLLSGVAGGLIGVFIGARFGGEDSGVPGFLVGGALGFGIGSTWYALTHQ